MTTIRITNPWASVTFDRDITGLTQAQLDAYAMLMEDGVREDLCAEGHETPEAFLAAYVNRVGPEQGGIVVLGS